MAWVPIAAAVAGSVASSAMNNSGKGGAASSRPANMAQMMPEWMRSKFESSIGGMPGTTNVNFGGMSYPSVYGPAMRAAKTVYSPQGANVTGQSTSPLASGLAAAAPWMWMAANNQGMYNFNSPGAQSMGQMGGYMNQIPLPAYSNGGDTFGYAGPYSW